ncbi:MAG: N-acetylneuraminate synthase family protein [Anaerolineales bacterium]|nr:MAG: N-acetylneuraminate synthase family protein [Anaerolineales bacterium]
MKIGNRDLTRERILIAEIGNNHEGDSRLAIELAHAAIESGADVVKVQIIDPERLVNISQTQRIEQLTRFRLPVQTFEEMAKIAHAKGALFMASAFDVDSLEAINPLLDGIKIASGDLDFHPLLVKAAGLGKPIILSTGMSTLAEIRTSVDVIASSLKSGPLVDHLALLHCVSLYPASLTDANLKVIQTLRETFNLTVGYSDHTLGIESAVASLGLGARIIEKHFTLDKTRTSFRDHALSADPADMRRLADVMHQYDAMLGSGEKDISTAEAGMGEAARRSIVAAKDLSAGVILVESDLDCIRPRNGLPPAEISSLIGKKLKTSLKRHDIFLKEHVE